MSFSDLLEVMVEEIGRRGRRSPMFEQLIGQQGAHLARKPGKATKAQQRAYSKAYKRRIDEMLRVWRAMREAAEEEILERGPTPL